jgi:hypothetical protein
MLEEINKWMRAFFWAGKDEVQGGQCLVAWRSICKPKKFGGLGVKDLRLQGLALRVRWHWLRRTDPERPWQGLPGLNDPEAAGLFQSLAQFTVGDGRLILFWRDRWIGGHTAEELAPEVFARVPTRRRNNRLVAEALHEDGWIDDIQGEMTAELWMQCLSLWEAVEEVEKDGMRPDHIAWKGVESGTYTAKGTYKMLCEGSVRWSMSEPVWSSFSPMKCKVFAWLALRYRLWTSDRRARHGLQEYPDTCYTCLQDEDNIDHILTLCPYARQVWCRVIQSANLRIADPGYSGNLQRWWTEARKRVRRVDRKRFDSMVISTAWTLWKQRNARAFRNEREHKTVDQMVVAIREEFHLWERAKRGGRIGIARE